MGVRTHDSCCTQVHVFKTRTVPQFVDELVDAFGGGALKCNVHLLTHLADNVRLHGPPAMTNMFAAERAYGEVAGNTSSNRPCA